MKRQTALRHLAELGEEATGRMRLRESGLGWAVEEEPWLAIHPEAEWCGQELRLPKRPMSWSYRPTAWPAWSHEHPRVARFWTAAEGLDQEVLSALTAPTSEPANVVEPSTPELLAQLDTELPVSRRHLRELLDHYWDQDWRRRHRAQDFSPEDHLWRAAAAVQELQDARERLEGPPAPAVNAR